MGTAFSQARRGPRRPSTQPRRDRCYWQEIVLRPHVEPQSGLTVYAEKEADRFLEELAEVIHGTYVFATNVHEDADCMFADEMVLPLRRADRQLA